MYTFLNHNVWFLEEILWQPYKNWLNETSDFWIVYSFKWFLETFIFILLLQALKKLLCGFYFLVLYGLHYVIHQELMTILEIY